MHLNNLGGISSLLQTKGGLQTEVVFKTGMNVPILSESNLIVHE